MNQIFKTTLFFILAFLMLYKTQAQTIVPFYNIGSTNVLPNSSLINSGEAHKRINNLLGGIASKHDKMYIYYKGQYYFKDNLVINIQAESYPPKTSRYKILSEMKKGYNAFFSQEMSPGTYFLDIKKINNYHVFINYIINDNTSKNAVIIDDQGTYMVSISVYGAKDSNSIQKAIDMLNQITDSIIFVVE